MTDATTSSFANILKIDCISVPCLMSQKSVFIRVSNGLFPALTTELGTNRKRRRALSTSRRLH
jgi:hypothetical protein